MAVIHLTHYQYLVHVCYPSCCLELSFLLQGSYENIRNLTESNHRCDVFPARSWIFYHQFSLKSQSTNLIRVVLWVFGIVMRKKKKVIAFIKASLKKSSSVWLIELLSYMIALKQGQLLWLLLHFNSVVSVRTLMKIIFIIYFTVYELQNSYEMISWIDCIFE